MYYTSKEVYLPGNHYTSRQVYEYISRQTNDPIVEWKTCVVSGTQFPIYQSDLDFYAKISPTFAGERFQIPTPTLCPEERQRRRLSFRNERKLYKRNCDATGDQIISIYSPDKPYKVYDQKFRRSDQWDPMDYGRGLPTGQAGFDFSKNFTENFRKLLLQVPRANFYGSQNENSDYTNHCNYSKDCYLCADLVRSESCLYSTTSIDSINTIDCFLATSSKYVYETSCSDNIYNSQYIINSKNCKSSSFLINCENCENCFGCVNLHNKSFYIFNKEFGEKEYFERLMQIKQEFNSTTKMIELVKGTIQNQFILQNCERCFGDNIQNSKNSILNFSLYDSQNIKYSYTSGRFTDSYDCLETGLNCSLLYECHAVMDSHKSSFISISYNNNNSYYLDNCYNSSHLFGCIGLRNKSYCIFNKQYTKEEYETQVARIIRHMMETGERGEFFHPSLSPFGYNETVAQEYYPVTPPSPSGDEVGVLRRGMSEGQGEVLGALGYHRSTYSSDPKIPEGARVIDCRLPERGEDTQQRKNLNQTTIFDYHHTEGPVPPTYDICKQIILCELSGRPFMLQKAEIDFYRKHNLPLPRKHPDVRHEERMKLRPGRTLFLRTCDCCGKEMLSVYPASQSGGEETIQKVYCEECYQKEVYG